MRPILNTFGMLIYTVTDIGYRLVHSKMSHFEEKMNPPHNVFHMVIELGICKIFCSLFDQALIEIHTFHLRHKSALNS